MLPNFLIIGANRSGTTYLKRNIESHPDIFMANIGYTGDIHFFDKNHPAKNWEKGLDWYKALFKNRNQESAVGEKSSLYFSDPWAPKLIKEVIPDIRMIVVLRNPIESAFSYYLFEKEKLFSNMAFIDVCKAEKGTFSILEESILHPGFYYQHLMNYLKHFRKEQIHIVIFDQLIKNARFEFEKLFRFLDVDSSYVPPELNLVINPGGQNTGTGQVLFYLWARLKKNVPTFSGYLKKQTTVELLRQAIGRRAEKKGKRKQRRIADYEYEYLLEIYKESNLRLGQEIGMDLTSLWNKPFVIK